MERRDSDGRPIKRFAHPAWPLAGCVPLALMLVVMRPNLGPAFVQDVDPGTANCLSNLNQIARAYTLYARDFDGKIPRGVDPEDHFNPAIWRNSEYGSTFYNDATQTPFLHVILRPYVKSPEVFHCPADVGWRQSRLPTLAQSSLQNVLPSSFKEYGTSYYCFTKYGFAQFTSADIPDPYHSLLLFDGDLWHVNAGRELLNGMFADGHAQNMSAAQFQFYAYHLWGNSVS